MKPFMHTQELTEMTEASTAERDLLAQWGFTSTEISTLLWLRQWYHQDSEQATRHLEFLRLLVRSGDLELV
ncbi:hypothetical protein KSF_092160 [Reticulibacter mediterranei]|uniref:Uncharacterized protein n=1 Tax=Reticulibacter mediterranei TaxID=2778369 RepID=A0A8J3IRT7_9CHLR|nr:hypothetical protein [Reticulibacter mediterranei]GHO99168.1 hypothetical protein KSF_092160 [Reticulibacter mediterranei]